MNRSYHKTEEYRSKMSLIKKGQIPWNKGLKYKTNPIREEVKRKISEAQKGEKNHNWKGGRCIENRTNDEYKVWRKNILLRDNWTCQKCLQRGGFLEAHHIENFSDNKELRYEVSNGITFCKKCHKKFHKLFGRIKNNIEQILEFLITI